MPFDDQRDHSDGGGGGSDPRHTGLMSYAEAQYEAIEKGYAVNDVCPRCAGLFLISRMIAEQIFQEGMFKDDPILKADGNKMEDMVVKILEASALIAVQMEADYRKAQKETE